MKTELIIMLSVLSISCASNATITPTYPEGAQIPDIEHFPKYEYPEGYPKKKPGNPDIKPGDDLYVQACKYATAIIYPDVKEQETGGGAYAYWAKWGSTEVLEFDVKVLKEFEKDKEEALKTNTPQPSLYALEILQWLRDNDGAEYKLDANE